MVGVSDEITLLGFQDDAKVALGKLVRKRLLGKTDEEAVLLKAPTGAGKTVIAGSVISDLVADEAFDICFVWLAPFRLQEQSLRSLREVLGSAQKLSTKDQIASAKVIEKGEVVFLNWASLNKDEANLIKGSEERDAFKQICQATRDRGRQIIAVIDESHHSSETAIAQEIKDMIGADVIFEMSATPHIKSIDGKHEVPRDEVVEAGLIKKAARINEGINEGASYTDHKLDELLLDLAVAKRIELAAAYKSEGSDVNPLLLIQLPDAKAGDDAISDVETHLKKKHSITYDTGRLARWLSGDATRAPDDLELIGNTGKVEVLIFKQAIATGWDCPRAHILLKLRDPGKSGKFEVQTIGRLMRMPERKHYEDERLNDAYVYHPHESYKPAEEFVIVTRAARWREVFQKPTLTTEWLVRGDTPYIEDAEAQKIARRAFEKLGVDPDGDSKQNKSKLTKANFDTKAKPDSKLAAAIIKGEDATEIEELGDVRVGVPAKLVERVFHRLVSRWVGVAENPGLVAEHLYGVAEQALGFDIPTAQAFIVKNEANLDQEMMAAVDEVTPRSSRSTREKRSATWSPQDPRPYNTAVGEQLRHEEVGELERCAYEPCLLGVGRSAPERRFEGWLSEDSGDQVLWWIKNGERGGIDFSLAYEFKGNEHNFFPDYVVGLAGGRVALYETKTVGEAFEDNETERELNEAKMAALRDWVAEEPADRAAAFIVQMSSDSLRWGIDEAPIGDAARKMPDLLQGE